MSISWVYLAPKFHTRAKPNPPVVGPQREFGAPRTFVLFVPGSVGALLAFFGLFWPSSLFGVYAGIMECSCGVLEDCSWMFFLIRHGLSLFGVIRRRHDRDSEKYKPSKMCELLVDRTYP